MHPTKSMTERVCQALGFEGLALLICTPLLVWITGRPALEMGAVTLGLSLLALTWNIIFNSLFDAGDILLVKGSKSSKVSLVVDALRKLGQSAPHIEG